MPTRFLPCLLGLCLGVVFCPRGLSQPAEKAAERAGEALPEGALFQFGGSSRYRHSDGITDSCLSPDGKLLAAISGASVGIWDVASGQRVQLLRELPECGIPGGLVGNRLAFSPDSKLLAHVCTYNFGALIWDVADGKLLGSVGRRPSRVQVPAAPAFGSLSPFYDDNSGIRFSADGKQLLLLGAFGVHAFDIHNAKRLWNCEVQTRLPFFTADGKHFAAVLPDSQGGRKQTLVLYETKSGTDETRFEIPVANRSGQSYCFASGADAKSLAMTDGLHIWHVHDKKQSQFDIPQKGQKPGTAFRFTRAHYSPDGKTLFAGTLEQGIRRYDLSSGKEQSPLIGHRGSVTGLHPTPDGKMLVSTSMDATIRRWDLASGKEIPLPDGYLASVSAARSADGKLLAVGDPNGRLDLWDAVTGKLVRNLRASGPGISGLSFSPNGKILAAAHEDGVIQMWEPAAGKEGGSVRLPEGNTKGTPDLLTADLVFNPDGSSLAAVTKQGNLHLWNVATLALLWSLESGKQVSCIAFAPDGNTIAAAAGMNNRPLFLEADTGKEESNEKPAQDARAANLGMVAIKMQRVGGNPLVAGNPHISSICYSSDGHVVATAHQGGQIFFWSPLSDKVLESLQGHGSRINVMRFSPDVKWLATGDDDGMVRLWELASAKEAHHLAGHKARIEGLDFGRDEKTIVSAGGTEVMVWDTRPSETATGDVAALWEDLLSPDAAKAYAAVWALAAPSKDAAAGLGGKLLPVDPREFARLPNLIADLASLNLARREAATKKLKEMGGHSRHALLAASRDPPSDEAGRRIDALLNAMGTRLSPEELRETRAVQALELAGTPAARQFLQHLARGAADANLTRDAKRALERLAQRGKMLNDK